MYILELSKVVIILNIFTNMGINLYFLLICILILIHEFRGSGRRILQDRLFKAILQLNIILIVLDSFGWIANSNLGSTIRLINFFTTTLNFLLAPLPILLWCIYADYQIFQNIKRLHKLIYLGSIPMVINALSVILSPFHGFVFYFDTKNIYHRGPFFMIFTITCYMYIFYSLVIVILSKNKIEKYKFLPMLLFPIPTIVGGILQNIFVGLPTVWAGSTISILILFFNIQSSRLNTDYVTGLYNRRQLDSYLNAKINNSNLGTLFAGIMIDMDKFKLINDTYGHQVGDEALVTLSKLLKKCFAKNDFIARYAGDEFVIVLDIKKPTDLNASIERLNNILKSYNSKSKKPYKLSLSLGHAIYDNKSSMSEEHFIKHLDSLMYKEKHNKKIQV